MEDKTSVVKLLGLPETFAVVLLTFSFVLLLAPYFSGADFGLFKIPQFTELARKKLKIIGPVVFLILSLLFLPVITRAPKPPANGNVAPTNINSTLATPRDVHNEVQQHLARARELYEERRYQEAINECDKALDLEPENHEALGLKTNISKTMEILKQNR